MKSRLLACALLGSVAFGLACGGGGDAPSFLDVVAVDPSNGREDVIVDTRVRVTLDAPIDSATVTAQTFFLTSSGGGSVPGTLRVLDDQVTAELTPDEPLTVLTAFTATVTTELKSTGGVSLEEDYQWTFTTLDAAWGEAEWIEPLGSWASRQQDIAVDQELGAVAVWQIGERAEPTGSVIANRYTRTDLWGEPVPIDDGNGLSARPIVASDGPGNAFVVWEQESLTGPGREIWTNRYDVAEASWEGPALLQTGDVTRAKLATVAADPAGNATAIYVQVDPIDDSKEVVRAIRYEPDAGWGEAETIATSVSNLVSAVTNVGMDDQGGAVAIWDLPGGTAGQGVRLLYSSHYTPSSGWSEPVTVKSDNQTSAEGFRLDVGAGGDAFAIWVQGNGDEVSPRDDIWAARFSAGAWSAPERIDTHDDGDKTGPDIAVDEAGRAYAAWSQADSDFANIYVAEYSPGTGWATPVLIEPPNEDPREDGDAETARVEVNRGGNVFVVWRQIFGQWPSIWSNQRDPGESWDADTAEVIEDFAEAANSPKIVVDDARHAHSIWIHNHSTGPKIRTNRFE